VPSISRTHTTLRRSLAIAAAVAITGFAGCSDNPSDMPGMDHGSSSSPTAASSSPTTGTPAAAAHNDNDLMFAQMMIPHHQQAIEMSSMILAKSGVNPQVADLANKIKTAQQPEIDTMTAWLQAWGESVTPRGMNHGSGGGMMTPEEMQQLDEADAATGQKLFIEGMIEHHRGAITMAQHEVANGQNPDAIALARKIIADQEAEITAMNQLLSQL
jgi:uncharacterized protein (DUF305 family)